MYMDEYVQENKYSFFWVSGYQTARTGFNKSKCIKYSRHHIQKKKVHMKLYNEFSHVSSLISGLERRHQIFLSIATCKIGLDVSSWRYGKYIHVKVNQLLQT